MLPPGGSGFRAACALAHAACPRKPLAQFGAGPSSTQHVAWHLTLYQPNSSWMQLACRQPPCLAAEDEVRAALNCSRVCAIRTMT